MANKPIINAKEARAMRRRGFTIRQIADHFGVTYTAVYLHFQPERVKRATMLRTQRARGARYLRQILGE